jgi:DNA-binding beta-propeller fold protein YncE
MRLPRPAFSFSSLLSRFSFFLFLSSSLSASERVVPGLLPSGEIQLPNGRLLTPTGAQTEVSPYPFALALTPDGTRVVVACTGADDQSLHLLDAASGKRLFKQPLPHSWLGLALSPDGARAYVAGAKGKNVLVYRLARNRFVAEEPISLKRKGDGPKLDATPGGLAISPDGSALWVARTLANDLVKIDLAAKKIVATVSAGAHPYRPVFSSDGKVLALAAWGGAAVTFFDPEKAIASGSLKTADHPGDLAFSPDARTLFVAQANRNLVAAVDVASRAVVRQIAVALGPDGPGTPSADSMPDGSTPNALALSPDGKTLFVANADDDAVAVVDLSLGVAKARAKGFIPSGWYPDALALSRDGRTLWVANGKGGGSWENSKGGPDPT